MKIGFIGIGIMGEGMAHNLLKSGFDLRIWNRSPEKCISLIEAGATPCMSPRELVEKSDITIAMLSDPQAATEVVFAENGVLAGMDKGKSYIDMSTVNLETVQLIEGGIIASGGRYLEAPVSGSKQPAADGSLVIMAAGDKALYGQAKGLFECMGKHHLYLGEAGNAARMKLSVNMIMAGMMGAFCEGMALADASGLSQESLLDILAEGALANPMFAGKGKAIIADAFDTNFPLKHMQKDVRLALEAGDNLAQPLPIAAATNELFKSARNRGFGDSDFSAIYKVIKKGDN